MMNDENTELEKTCKKYFVADFVDWLLNLKLAIETYRKHLFEKKIELKPKAIYNDNNI